ncbi:hypothetical protein [Aromatoleum anaerobium]|uniref:Uncharacterized protein n=1 Tax=Aromatoleum anaerobium TaxID=182180 RepID=A0ABX1PR76_9RHOO|nr:hypothetical protein [Aromatoleum anaerobium]MCK0505365.1 hypothetical protein [Aromatoleum anaerobium]
MELNSPVLIEVLVERTQEKSPWPFLAETYTRIVPLSRVRPPLSGPSTTHISAQFGPCAYERFTPSCAPFETPLSNPSKWRHYADHARRLYADP